MIREASTTDARSIAEVHVAGWRETYAGILPFPLSLGLTVEQRSAMWDAARRREASTLLVGEDEVGAVVGFGAAGPARQPLFRDNLGARRFYEHLGAELVDEREKDFGEVTCAEVAYGWRDLQRLAQVVGEGRPH